jgi:hypothetical protein
MGGSFLHCIEITDQCTVENSKYGYIPNLSANAAFLVIFGILSIIHAYLGFRTKTWFFGAMMFLGSSTEAIGYVGRTLLHKNVYNLSA